MKFEICSHSLPCSRYGPAPVVADDLHVVHTSRGSAYAKIGRALVSLITPYATRPPGAGKANLLSDPNEMNVEQDR